MTGHTVHMQQHKDKMKCTVKYWQWTEISSEPSWNCPQTESCERSMATGSMLPDLRRQMHVRRTLFSSTELKGCCEQMTEFDLQHRNLCRARINMQGPVHASLCSSSDSVWTGCAVPQPANAADCKSSRWHASISYTAKHPCCSIHHTLQTIKSVVRQSNKKLVTVVNPAVYKAVTKDLAISNGSALIELLILLCW